jgi:hypothetical protein
LDFSLGWLTMDAPGSVPWISSNNIFDSVNEFTSSIILTLTEIFGLA